MAKEKKDQKEKQLSTNLGARKGKSVPAILVALVMKIHNHTKY